MRLAKNATHTTENMEDAALRPVKKDTNTAKDRQFVTALARGLQILGCFSTKTPELNGSDLAKLTGLPQPTVWRLCHTLLELGMLIPTSGDKMRPGLPVLRLGYSAISGLDIIELARPHMQELANRYGAACALAIRDGLDMVMIERCEGHNQLLMNLRVGSSVPIASSALGWAYLAGLPSAPRAHLLAEIEAGNSREWNAVKKDFKKASADFDARGFILNAGTFHKAYNTIAVPIFAADGSIQYSLNCGSAALTLSEQTLHNEVAPKLLALARLLQSALVIRN